jgi:hypothetical protein
MLAVRSGASRSVVAAARDYKVSKTTLLRRLKGIPSREDWKLGTLKLSPIEESVLVQDILQLDSQGLSPTIALIEAIANSICKAKGVAAVGQNWTRKFIKRSPILTIKLGRTYECQRRLCETPEVIEAWFALVRNTINKYSVLHQDVYNFDETGF